VEHAEYKRIVPGADTAVLLIHGIAGTPNHFREFIPRVPEQYSVYNLLLDGHGRGVRDFSASSMDKWERQVDNVVTALLSEHDRVLIAAHSMGTLFAIEQAIKHPQISGLFLLAVPIKLFLKPRMAVNSLKVFFNCIKPEDAVATAARECYGIASDRNPFHYLGWIPRYLELFRKIREIRGRLPELETPGKVYQSARDEMVSKRSADYLRKHSGLTVCELPNAGHYYYEKAEYELLISEFSEFMN